MRCDYCREQFRPGTQVVPHVKGDPHPEKMLVYRADGHICATCAENYRFLSWLGRWAFRRSVRNGAKHA